MIRQALRVIHGEKVCSVITSLSPTSDHFINHERITLIATSRCAAKYFVMLLNRYARWLAKNTIIDKYFEYSRFSHQVDQPSIITRIV